MGASPGDCGCLNILHAPGKPLNSHSTAQARLTTRGMVGNVERHQEVQIMIRLDWPQCSELSWKMIRTQSRPSAHLGRAF